MRQLIDKTKQVRIGIALHRKLKVRAAKEVTTIRALLEEPHVGLLNHCPVSSQTPQGGDHDSTKY